MRRPLTILGFALALAGVASSARAMGDLTASATTNGADVVIGWDYNEYTPGCAEFVGYDVYRRRLDDCNSWTRVNAAMVPRPAGMGYSQHQITDTPPLSNVMYEYRVDFVDALRNPAICAGLCGLCSRYSRASVPALSAPITHGRIEELGTIAILPCANSCYSPFFIWEPEVADQLRPYAGTGETIRFWGYESCNGFEGCALQVTNWEVAGSDETPARRSTWGQVKTLYR